MVTRKFVLAATCAAGCMSVLSPMQAMAADAGVSLDMRYRIESVSDDAVPEDALASTLRTRLGYRTEKWRDWQAFVEFEDVRAFGLTDYNSTANGKTQYAVVADSEDTELNQAYVGRSVGDASIRIGRQRINITNQRFIGAVGFRQNEQTFDALMFDTGLAAGKLQLGYLDRVNRIFGEHHPNQALADTETRSVLADYERLFGDVNAAAYAYLVELPDSPLASHRNLGVRASSGHGQFEWRAEFARQDAYGDGADIVGASYYRIDLGWDFEVLKLELIREVLGGDGNYAFQTPFATLHAFNGATDKFLVTPIDGLVDDSLRLSGTFGEWKYGLVYHRFNSDTGSISYGDEVALHAKRPLGKVFDAEIKVAQYSADQYAADTLKVLFMLGARF